jgi:hypothetical protein
VWVKNWRDDASIHNFWSFPFFLIYFIWWERNVSIFQDNSIPLGVVAYMVLKLACEFNMEKKSPKIKKIMMLNMDKSIPWGYFDGASKDHPSRCGAGVVLSIS